MEEQLSHTQEPAVQLRIKNRLLKGAYLLLMTYIDYIALTREGDINPLIGTCLS